MLQQRTALERFWDRTIKPAIGEPHIGCWRWTGARNPDGYGTFYVDRARRSVPAHRFAYEQFVGPIPEGRHIDHLCRHRWCVNPYHMEPVTPAENTLRGESFSALNAQKTHCPQGHPYDEANTYVGASGARYCRTCIHARRQPNYTPLTRREPNTRGGRKRQTHCHQGHEYSPENTMWETPAKRKCRTCHNAKCRRLRAAKSAHPS